LVRVTSLSCSYLLSFTPQPPPALFPLSLHDALPICAEHGAVGLHHMLHALAQLRRRRAAGGVAITVEPAERHVGRVLRQIRLLRSEEHTSELQSHLNLVCRRLLEKKKKSRVAHQTR